MIKVKHARTADCVVAGFRWHKSGKDAVGSLLLGLYDDAGRAAARRRHLVVHHGDAQGSSAKELAPLRKNAFDAHPWREWAEAGEQRDARACPAAQSRWSAGKDLSWEPLRIERVCEVKYDHLQGDRFRHAAIFLRWRPDKPPSECRYDQLEVTPLRARTKVVLVGSSGSCAGRSSAGTCSQVHAHARPGGRAPAHGVDQHIRGLEMRRGLGVARLPALEPGQRVFLALGAADLDQRVLRHAAPSTAARAAAPRAASCSAAARARRPARRARAAPTAPAGLRASRLRVDVRVPVAEPAKRAGIVRA